MPPASVKLFGPGWGVLPGTLLPVIPYWSIVVAVISIGNTKLDETVLFILPSCSCLGTHHMMASETMVRERGASALVSFAV